jgi:cytochrome P450 family 138
MTTLGSHRSTRTSPARANVPPGPRMPKPWAGYVVLFNHMPTLRRLQQRYGDAFSVKLPVFGPSVVVSSPEYVKQVFTASPDVLIYGPTNPLGEVMGPGSLFALDGDAHRRERKLLLPPFHGERMRSYEGIIEEEALREMANWKEGEEFATLPSFMQITVRAIVRAVFGAHGEQQRELIEILPKMVSHASIIAMLTWLRRDLGPRSPGRQFTQLRKRYDRLIDTLIEQAIADPKLEEREDVLALLVRAKYDDGSAMTRSGIADELFALLAAGHETTATSLAWAVERLRRHPAVLARLQAEAQTDAKELRVAAIHEVQRTRPVIHAADRGVAADEFAVGDYRLPKGYRIMLMATLIHNDARFFDRPEQFDPDRFVERAPNTYTWIPFGGGTRRCIGAAFAQMEMNVVLRTLLREFELQATDDPDEKWRPRGIAFAPARGGRAFVRRSGHRAARSAGTTADLATA